VEENKLACGILKFTCRVYTEDLQGKSKDKRKHNTLNPVACARFMNTAGEGTSGSLV
jgi:hypothetical protein